MPIWGVGPRQEIRLTNIDRKNLFVLRSACCGRSSTTAAARGNYRQIPSFTMSISLTRTRRVAKLVLGRRPDAGLHNGLASWDGGARRDRTDDLKLAKLALSQLSYGPGQASHRDRARSPIGTWWAWEDLNFRPHAYQARALTN